MRPAAPGVALLALGMGVLLACRISASATPTPPPPQDVAQAVTQTLAALYPSAATYTLEARFPSAPTSTPTRLPQPSLTPTPLPSPVLPAFYEPAGCQKPPDGNGTVEVNGWTLNERTLAMLRHAQELYGGSVDLAGSAVTQGSYHDNGAASFGTHLGGGAVDLSIFLPGTWTVDYAHLMRMVRALRVAGFAAWVRNIDEVYPGSGFHIHAIAIGDPELSKEAQDQLTGTYGYFRGYNGLPKEDGVPVVDREGGPILCRWMVDMGYADLRADASQPTPPWPPADWPARLEQAAQASLTGSQEETVALARRLNLLLEPNAPAVLLEGPLAGALWRDSGLAPAGLTPTRQLRNYFPAQDWPAHFAAWLPEDDFEHLHFDTPPAQFDFAAQPLRPGDLLYLQGASRAHVLLVTEVTPQGKAWTVVPLRGEDGQWRVERVRLFAPAGEQPGLLAGAWAGENLSAWDLFRYRWSAADFEYTVQSGDTLPVLAARFGVSVEDILQANALDDPGNLTVGQMLAIHQK